MLVLASGSATRLALLRSAGLEVEAVPPRVDEAAAKAALLAEGFSARDVADALAELKGGRVAQRRPEALVVAADQVLEVDGEVLSKPESEAEALDQLMRLAGRRHSLFAAATLHRLEEAPEPLWRHVSEARLTMRPMSEDWLRRYVVRSWESIRHSVGGYLIEGEGARLMSRVEGDHWTVLGLPLLPLIDVLERRGDIPR